MNTILINSKHDLIDLIGNTHELPNGKYGYIKYTHTTVIYKPIGPTKHMVYLHVTPKSFNKMQMGVRDNTINNILNGE